MCNRPEENSTSHVIDYFSSVMLSKMKSTNTTCNKALGREYAVACIHAGGINTQKLSGELEGHWDTVFSFSFFSEKSLKTSNIYPQKIINEMLGDLDQGCSLQHSLESQYRKLRRPLSSEAG